MNLMLGVPLQEILLVVSCQRNRDQLRPDGPFGSSADLTRTLLRMKEETLIPNLLWSVCKLTVEKQSFPENNTEFVWAAAFPLSLRSGFSDLPYNSRARVSNRDGGVTPP